MRCSCCHFCWHRWAWEVFCPDGFRIGSQWAIFISGGQAIGVVDDRRGVVVSLGVGAGAPAVSGLGRVAADPERHGDDVGRDPRSLRSSASMRPYCRRCMVCAWSL